MLICSGNPILFFLILGLVVHRKIQYRVHVPTTKDIDRLFEISRYGLSEAYVIRSAEKAAPLLIKYLGSDRMYLSDSYNKFILSRDIPAQY